MCNAICREEFDALKERVDAIEEWITRPSPFFNQEIIDELIAEGTLSPPVPQPGTGKTPRLKDFQVSPGNHPIGQETGHAR